MIWSFIAAIIAVGSISNTSGDEKAGPCTSPNAGQFDFWIGDWDVSWKDKDGKELRGTNTVAKILGGCVVQEFFKDPNTGFEGVSHTVYDTTRNTWLQTWVDNTGSYLDFTGEFRDGKMILQRTLHGKNKEFIQRMVWYNIRTDELDWSWERSDDDGATWSLLWQIHYSRRR